MNKYFFVFGRNYSLSVAELTAVFKLQKIYPTFLYISQEAAVISCTRKLDPEKIILELGGTIKIGSILDEVGLETQENEFYSKFKSGNLIGRYIEKSKSKVHFGISFYNLGGEREIFHKLISEQKNLNLLIKENLKKEGFRAGFVRIKERYLSSVSVVKNKLLSNGAEIVFLVAQDRIFIAKTESVQDFAGFSLRDAYRPFLDKKSGIMPAKLARVMLNLAQVDKGSVILDPFCGSGTIVQEAIVLGYRKIIAADISSQAIENTKRNIEWLFIQCRKFDKMSYNIDFQLSDAAGISQKILPRKVDAVITEPYLGPPLYKKPSPAEIDKIFYQVNSLYLSALREFAKILPKHGKIVIVFPAFEIDKRIYLGEFPDRIKHLGLATRSLLSGLNPAIDNENITGRNSILYRSAHQFLIREIISFVKT